MARGVRSIRPTMKLEMPAKVTRRYRCIREIGRGGMGIVYEVVDEYTSVHRALKLMTVDIDDPRLIARFSREARIASVIGGEHVVKVVDTDVASELGDRPFIVMELLRGRDVEALLATRGRFSVEEARVVLEQLASALEQMHGAGIVHRDLKPANLFLHEEANGRTALRVLDFGIAKLVEPDLTLITEKGEMIGTPRYMAPEQARAEIGPVGPPTDLWAVAMIAVEMLTGVPYWDAPTPIAIVTKIMTTPAERPSNRWAFLPPGFDDWFTKSCARRPDDRFQTAREQIDALNQVLSGAYATQLMDRTLRVTPVPPRNERNDRGERAERSVPPVAYAPRVDAAPLVTPTEGGRLRAAALVSGAIALVLLGIVTGTAMFSQPAASGVAATQARGAVVDIEPLVLSAVVRAEVMPVLGPGNHATPSSSTEPTTQPATTEPARDHVQTPAQKPAPASGCEEPSYVDGEGLRRYRPECIER
jgi:serine/threonine protein kinase